MLGDAESGVCIPTESLPVLEWLKDHPLRQLPRIGCEGPKCVSYNSFYLGFTCISVPQPVVRTGVSFLPSLNNTPALCSPGTFRELISFKCGRKIVHLALSKQNVFVGVTNKVLHKTGICTVKRKIV